jgi:hypothetical protein
VPSLKPSASCILAASLLMLEPSAARRAPVRAGQRMLDPLAVRFEADHLLREPLDYLPSVGCDVEIVEGSSGDRRATPHLPASLIHADLNRAGPHRGVSSRCLSLSRFAGISLRALRRTTSGTSSFPIPWPVKSSSIVTCDR